MLFVDANFNKTKCTDCSITVLRPFKSECNITNILEGIPTFYHSILLYLNLSLAILANSKFIPIKPT